MATITQYFEQAQLSLAAYALGLQSGMFGSADVNYTSKLEAAGMSPTQAANFAATYTVIDQYTDTLGFSATLFQRGAQKYLAIRGTEGSNYGVDFFVDFGIFTGTGAVDQYMALEAYYQRLLATGKLSASEQMVVSGHSLGGFLAQGFAVDYPSAVSQTYTYNAPGLGGLAAEIFQAMGWVQPNVPLSNIINIRAEPGLSATAALGTVLGNVQPIFIEANLDPIHNHSITTLTDALALYKLFATVDPNASVGTITDILEAASNTAANSLESALAAVGKIFGKTYSAIETTRDDLYAHLYDLQAALSSSSAGLLTVESLAGKSAADIATLAKSDLATRYALNELNPFAITGDAGLYAPFNAHGELDLYDPATGAGNLSDLYLADRAALLSWKDYFNKDDKPPVKIDYKGEQYAFKDGTSGYTALLGNDSNIQSVPVSTLRQIRFGTGADDTAWRLAA
ncbi:MAG: hypothetical protein ACYC2R_15900 [Burkholderiales bacterium]